MAVVNLAQLVKENCDSQFSPPPRVAVLAVACTRLCDSAICLRRNKRHRGADGLPDEIKLGYALRQCS